MRAFRVLGKDQVELRELPDPEPGPGEVRIRVAANGLCHSDVGAVENADVAPFLVPRTLGHETTGWVDLLGSGVQGVEVGAPVGVYSLRSCYSCDECLSWQVNLCRRRFPPALGFNTDGGLADHMVVPADNLVALGDADPVHAAPLMDAGITSYRGVRLVRDRLRPGARVVVIGVGGLGHIAVQIAKATSAAEVIAVDIDDERLALAGKLGADHAVRVDDGAVERIREWCHGLGADAVLDFVGAEQTLALGRDVVATGGRIVIIGLAGGTLPVAALSGQALPHGVDVSVSIYGSRQDVREVSLLMAAGHVEVTSTTYPLDRVATAWEDLVAGRVLGRAIVVP